MNYTEVPWALIGAIIGAMVAGSSKLFEYFDNKNAKDLKLLIDIQKGLNDIGQDRNLIRRAEKLTQDSLLNFLEGREEKISLKKKYPKRYSLYLHSLWIGTILIFITIIVFVISIFSKFSNPELSHQTLEAGTWCVIGLLTCYAITSVLDRIFKR